MWETRDPNPVKLIIGILASNEACLTATRQMLADRFGSIDLASDIWTFDKTNYYRKQTGTDILRQFVTIEQLIHPGQLAQIKHQTNQLEQDLAQTNDLPFPRPVNLDPGIIEPSKLVLASTKNYSHRIYIGQKMYAEVTLLFDRGAWRPLPYTYPDYYQSFYFEFFDKVRDKLLRQLKSLSKEQ